MRIVGLDLETTGLAYGDHKIVEAYIGLWNSSTRTVICDINRRIDPQRSISAESQRVHGISLADVAGCLIWDDVATEIHHLINQGDLIVAHNGKHFDMPFLNYEFERVGLPKIDLPIFDTMLECRWATFTGAVPSLQALCFACDVEYDVAFAHAADYDVHCMMDCFFRGVEWGNIKLPETIELADAA